MLCSERFRGKLTKLRVLEDYLREFSENFSEKLLFQEIFKILSFQASEKSSQQDSYKNSRSERNPCARNSGSPSPRTKIPYTQPIRNRWRSSTNNKNKNRNPILVPSLFRATPVVAAIKSFLLLKDTGRCDGSGSDFEELEHVQVTCER